MPSGDFVPFAPRRIIRTAVAESDALAGAGELAVSIELQAQDEELAGTVDPVNESSEDDKVVPDTPTLTEALGKTDSETSPEPSSTTPAAILGLVREQAIELAATACARALRVAAIEDPQVVIRFVDEALAIASVSSPSAVRTSVEDAPRLAGFNPPVRADALLERGDVIVETPAGSVEGRIEDRAWSLVRWAARG